MSTRAVIARPMSGAHWEGRYHHWDGYPSGLGATLYQWRNGHFKGDTGAMLRYLLDGHKAGWSTINGGDPSLPAGHRDSNLAPCRVCRAPWWMHYRQYYQQLTATAGEYAPGRYNILGLTPPDSGTDDALIGHTPEPVDEPRGPECHCHDLDTGTFDDKRSDRGDRDVRTSDETAADVGCEWAYVLDESLMTIYAAANEDGSRMVGMFGSGNAEAAWPLVATVDLDGPEPSWKGIEEAWYARCRLAQEIPALVREVSPGLRAHFAR